MKLAIRRGDKMTNPAPRYDQDEQRLRRRRWLPNVLGAEFDLGREVEAIVGPLAVRVAGDPWPAMLGGGVQDVADAVTVCLRELNDLFSADGDRSRVRHLTSEEDRARALSLLRSRRAASAPEFTGDDLAAGSWAPALVELAAPSSAPLSRYLGRVRSDATVTATQVVEAALRGIDRAAISLERRIDRRAADRAQFPATSTPAASVEDQLERLGVKL